MKKTIAVSLILGVMLMTMGLVIAGGIVKKSAMVVSSGTLINVQSQAISSSPVINLIGELDSESVSYTKYHGNGIYSTTHVVRKDYARPDKVPKPEKTKGPACYKLMGVKWMTTPDYAVEESLFDIVTTSIVTWDDEVTGFSLLGERSSDIGHGFEAVMDGKNSYSMGNYPTENVIAVCRTWYNIYTNKIVEYDIMFDTDFEWGNAETENGVMDYQNIATHEIGHAFGLLDLYQKPCAKQTMYGYSSYGEISKRDLNTGDIAGIQTIYGA